VGEIRGACEVQHLDEEPNQISHSRAKMCTYPGTSQFVQHPVLGCIETLQVLLWSTWLFYVSIPIEHPMGENHHVVSRKGKRGDKVIIQMRQAMFKNSILNLPIHEMVKLEQWKALPALGHFPSTT
jgi:hypothetical protein